MKSENEIDFLLTPESETLSFKIPVEWIGRKLKVTAVAVEDVEEEQFDIPEWHKELVLTEKLRVEENTSLLISLEAIRKKYASELI